MPELPDVLVYLDALSSRLTGRTIEEVVLRSPFLVRTFDPPIERIAGLRVLGFERLGKRIVFTLDGDLFVVVHLMIAGRFQWKPATSVDDARSRITKQRIVLAAFVFENGALILTEAGSKKRASVHVVQGRDALDALDPGGADVRELDAEGFRDAVRSTNRTLKRALTDPRTFSGIGNAYSDEILHRARLSPVQRTANLSEDEIERLREACVEVLEEWIQRFRDKWGGEFPSKVRAFQPEMAVHGKYREPCPECGTAVQRIVKADNECNYCPRCQTGGKLLKDRALSKILREEWPATIEEWEEGS